MQKQIGKIGAIRRELRGKACTSCGGHTYQIVLRSSLAPENARVYVRCIQCHRARGIESDLGKVLWM